MRTVGVYFSSSVRISAREVEPVAVRPLGTFTSIIASSRHFSSFSRVATHTYAAISPLCPARRANGQSRTRLKSSVTFLSNFTSEIYLSLLIPNSSATSRKKNPRPEITSAINETLVRLIKLITTKKSFY